jgi:hypothetical protein
VPLPSHIESAEMENPGGSIGTDNKLRIWLEIGVAVLRQRLSDLQSAIGTKSMNTVQSADVRYQTPIRSDKGRSLLDNRL